MFKKLNRNGSKLSLILVLACNSMSFYIYARYYSRQNTSPVLISTFCPRYILTESIKLLLNTRFAEKHELWGKISEYNKDEIEKIIDIILPTVNSNSHKERSMIFDKDMPAAKEKQYVEEHKDWPDESYLWEPPLNQKVGKDVIIGMKDIQHLIFNHQHPNKCENRKFLVLESKRSGLGSQYHITGIGLGMALDMNRIAIWDKNSDFIWNKGPFCDNTDLNGHDCFFEPLSNCSIQSIGLNPMDSHNPKTSPIWFERDYINRLCVPEIIKPILERIMIPKSLWYFYWRLSAITYFIRYSKRTKKWIDDFEKEFLSNPGNDYDISIHIRHHEEKKNEMAIVDFPNYYKVCKVIEKLLNKNRLNVFLSSEDPDAISWFKDNTNYCISYFNYTHRHEDLYQLIPLGANLTRRLLANLKHSVFSKFVIGTLGSNWNRLITEIRMTTAGYANEIYLEAGDHTCVSVEHCKFTNQEFHMNW